MLQKENMKISELRNNFDSQNMFESISSFPSQINESFDIEMDLEHVCQDALYDWLDKKALKKDMKGKYLFVEKGQLMAYKKNANDTETSFKHFFEKNHPNQKCLNFLPFDDALKLYKECA